MSEQYQGYPSASVYAPAGAMGAAPQGVPAGAVQGMPQMPPMGTAPVGATPNAAGVAVGTAAATSAAAPAQPKKNTGFIVVIVILSVLLLGALSVAGCSASMALTSGMPSFFNYGTGSNYMITGETVAVIDLNATIDHGAGNCSPEGLAELLDEIESNDLIKAVVLHVNSGGGASTAGEEMSILIAQCTKPVVVSSASTNASAAYEISSQADYIFVDKSTFIGSIGTALQFRDLSGLYEMLGIRYQDIVSHESKDASYGTRPLTDEEVAYYQAIIDEVNEGFIETVAAGRGMDKEAVRALATGALFSGLGAVENGLADAVGTFEDALAYAAELGGITGEYDVVNMSAPNMALDLLSLLMEGGMSAQEAAAVLAEQKQAQVLAYSFVGTYAVH